MTEQRRLAAILVADVVGYSKLIGSDEAGTLAQLQALRTKVIEPQLAVHAGRLFKSVGDGFLVEFASAVQAVSCALAIQEANAAGRLPLRVGLHLGDVVVQGEDLMGDGVNIAARIESVAEPRGVALSRAVHEQVQDKLDLAFIDAGEVELKNIARPVRIFLVAGGSSRRAAEDAPMLAVLNKPSIAVLPFQNMSGDPEQEYFADGMVEDIITALSRFRSLFVIARNSSFTYKGKSVDSKQVGRELGVRYLLEGSVRRAANRVRVTAQLVDTSGASELWAERYDREMTDVFVVQDEITARIATAVDPAIRQVEGQIAIRKRPSDLRSWDHLLRGLWHVNQFKKSSNSEARREFERAIALDPKYALAHAWIALTHVFEAWFNWTDEHSKHLAAAHRSATEAVRLDEGEPMAHVAVAFASFWTARIDQARVSGLRALSLNANSFMASLVCGGALNYSGECAEAVQHHLKALDLSPNDPVAWNCLGSLAHTYLNLRQFDDAVTCADRALGLRHGYLFARVVKVSALGHAGRLQEGRHALDALLGVAPDFTVARMDHYPFVLVAQRQHLIDGLAAAGLSISSAPSGVTGQAALPLPDKPSIAVLPFQNMSGDPQQEYFADGIVEDIITALSRFKSLFVIARNSSFSYKGKSPDIRQVGRELGVRYVLEGSVRKTGGRVRITGQLIDASSGGHLWADRFDSTLDDVFDLQDRVASSIVGAIAPKVEQSEIARAKYRPAGNFDAYDYLLRAMARLYDLTGPATDETLSLINAALERDPKSAMAHAVKAFCYSWRYFNGWMHDFGKECADSERHALRALELAGDDASVLAYCGYTLAAVNGQLSISADLIERALELNPNLALAWGASGWLRAYRGEAERAIEDAKRALRLSPIDVNIQSIRNCIAQAHFGAGRFAEASSWARLALQAKAGFAPSLRILAATEALMGNMESARKYREELQKAFPNATLSSMSKIFAPFRPEHVAKMLEGLSKAGLPEE